MNVSLKVSPEQFCRHLFDIINTFSPDLRRITTAEAELMTAFLLLPSKFEHKRFSGVAKKMVSETTGYKIFNINNKLSALTEKGYIYRDDDGVLYPKKALTSAVSSFLTNKKLDFNIAFTYATV